MTDHMRIHELHYSNTNTYLIESESGKLLFDTGWAGTFQAFCRAMKDTGIQVKDIDLILISHFHPDHMGIAQEIANLGVSIFVADVQKEHIHDADGIFAKEKGTHFEPVIDEKVRYFSIEEGRKILNEIDLKGQIIHTPGHSDDSISLILDDGSVFVGDLNPIYELELHKGTQIEASWNKLLELKPKTIYYGHAKTARLDAKAVEDNTNGTEERNKYALVSAIIRYIDKGYDIEKIQKKTGSDREFIEDVMRMYLTHTNVGVQGILDRIEIKNR